MVCQWAIALHGCIRYRIIKFPEIILENYLNPACRNADDSKIHANNMKNHTFDTIFFMGVPCFLGNY
jgi:hypothetical protein